MPSTNTIQINGLRKSAHHFVPTHITFHYDFTGVTTIDTALSEAIQGKRRCVVVLSAIKRAIFGL